MKTSKAVILLILLSVLMSGCSSMGDGLRKEKKVTHGLALSDYESARVFYNNLEIGSMAHKSLTGSKHIDIGKGNVLGFGESLALVLPHPSMSINDLPKDLATAVRNRSLRAIRLKGGRTKTKGEGSLFKELTSLERISRTKGWKAEITIFFSENIVLDKTFSGTRDVNELEQESDFGKALSPRNLLKII